MPDTRTRIEEVFCGALELPDGRRDAFLDEVCGNDGELRQQVESLLATDRDSDGFMETLPSIPPDRRDSFTLAPGTRVGAYQIESLLASGGMGNVYVALQDRPRRKVALKILRLAVASASARRRFAYESELLGRLSHSAVARIYEAGMWAEGNDSVPYLAMEFIEHARPITAFTRDEHLSIVDRLRLFVRVCDGVQHGHQSGVIHRDLKPDNILVDQHGHPKIIDFGVARAVESEAAVTVAGQLLGTLAYMSPEQCLGDPDRIDTRADVYSLGVVLYELVTDKLPFAVSAKPVAQSVRIIAENDPVAISSIDRALRGDLDTIVMKALSKKPQERYASVSEFASDIERHLRNEPIQARPPSAVYLVRRFARRHQPLVVGVAAVLLSLLIGIAGTTFQMFRAIRAEDLAENRRRAAVLANLDAQEDAAKYRVTEGFLRSMFSAAAPHVALGRPAGMLEQIVREADADVRVDLRELPQIRGLILHTIGETYHNLGAHDEAARALRDAHSAFLQLGRPEDAELLAVESLLSQVLLDQGRTTEAQALLEHAITGQRQLAPGNDLARSLKIQGRLYSLLERWDDAESALHQSIELFQRHAGADSIDTAMTLNDLGDLDARRGNLERAETNYRKAVSIVRAQLSATDPRRAQVHGNLARVYVATSRFADAEQHCRAVLEIYDSILAPDHPHRAEAASLLGECLIGLERHSEAEQLLLGALDTLDGSAGADQQTRQTVKRIIRLYESWRKPEAAAGYRVRLPR